MNIIRKLTKSKIPTTLLWLVPVLFLVVFYFYPLGSIFAESFTPSRVDGGNPLVEVLTNPSILKTIGFTFWQAILSTILTLIVGLPGAYLLAKFKFPGKSLFKALTGLPFVMPTIVVATAFNAFLGSKGFINILLMDWFNLAEPPITFINTFSAILIAHVFYNTTIVFRMVGDHWSHLDPRMEQAGRVLGAGRWQSFRRITLPLLLPALAAAALLIFLFDFSSFGVVLLLGGPKFATMEVEIYYQTVGLFNLPVAASLSLLQLLFTLIIAFVYTRLTRAISRPIKRQAEKTTQINLITSKRKWSGIGLILIYLAFFTLPLGSLAARSFTRLEPDRGQHVVDEGLTLDFYRELGINRRNSIFYASPTTAIATSVSYAGVTVVAALLLGLPLAWVIAQKEEMLINKILDPILMLPIGTSAVTLGLGFLLALDTPPLDLRASPILIPLAHTLVALPFVVRSLAPALRSIQPQIRQAASVLGAGPGIVFQRIDLPMIGKAVLVSATFAFTISLGEFGATALISRPEYPTIPVAIFRFISQPGGMNYGQALALSTILMVVTAVSMVLIERARIADVGEF